MVLVNLLVLTVDNTVGDREHILYLVFEVVIGERGPGTRLLVLTLSG